LLFCVFETESQTFIKKEEK